jgi:hypothetical protein
MKQLSKFLTLLLVMAMSIPMIFLNSCEDDDYFNDVVPDIAKAIIRDFKVAGKSADINHNTGTISMTLPSGTDISKVNVDILLPEGTTISPSEGTLDFSKGPVVFTTTSLEGANREYTANIGVYGNPKILNFTIAGKAASIDDISGLITIEIGSLDGSLSNLTPSFVIADGTTVDIASGVSRNFNQPVKYTVLSNDGYTAKEYRVVVTQIEAPIMNSFKIGEVVGIIDQTKGTVSITLPGLTNITSITPQISTPMDQTVSPSGAIDFTNPVTYVITNKEGREKSYLVTVTLEDVIQTYAFIGLEASINELKDDDAKAAAEFMQNTYGAQFIYLQANKLTTEKLADVKVAMLYYLTPRMADNTRGNSFSANNESVFTMLPSELQPGTSQTRAVADWVKAGGNLFIAGDPNPFVGAIGRRPMNGTRNDAPGNYRYTEIGCSGADGCYDLNKPDTDRWGLSLAFEVNGNADISTTTSNMTLHPIFKGLNFELWNGEAGRYFLPLSNAPNREARLIWTQHWDGVISPGCCSPAAVAKAESTLAITKFASFNDLQDGFGYAAVMYNPTNGGVDAEFDSNIGLNWKGSVFTLENMIIGYEWDSNNSVNPSQANIEILTKNILEYLHDLN